MNSGLLAFADGVYQILPLEAPMPMRRAPPTVAIAAIAAIELVAPAAPNIDEPVKPASLTKAPTDPVTARHHLAAILATLGASMITYETWCQIRHAIDIEHLKQLTRNKSLT
jgi:hypothetical protein